MDDQEVIEEATKMLEKCVANANIIKSNLKGVNYNQNKEKVHEALKGCDELFDYILKNFRHPKNMKDDELANYRKDIRTLLIPFINDGSVCSSYRINIATFPVHAMKVLMKQNMIPIQLCKNFKDMVKVYLPLLESVLSGEHPDG